MKTYSSWNQQHFNEYLHKSNQYEISNHFKKDNSFADKKPSCNIYDYKNSSSINKQQNFDNFYFLPGVCLSDEVPLDYNRMERDEKILPFPEFDAFKSHSKPNTFSSLEPLRYHGNNQNLISNDAQRCDANLIHQGDGCTTAVHANPSLGTLQKAFVQAAYNLKLYLESTQMTKSDIVASIRNLCGDNVMRIDRSAQTPDLISKITKTLRTLEKANQTDTTKVKDNGISPDPFMNHTKDNNVGCVTNSQNTKIEFENKSEINNIKFKNQVIERDLFTTTPSPVIQGSKLKVSESKISNGCKKIEILTHHHSDSENENINDSNLEELTMISKTNSKFASFNEILGNLGLHLQNSEESIKNLSPKKSKFDQDNDNHIPSFWDNPLGQLELVKSEPQSGIQKNLFADFAEKSNDIIKQSLREPYEALGTGKDTLVDIQKTLNQNDDRTCNEFVDHLKTKPYGMENKTKAYGYRYNSSRKSNFLNSGMKFTKSFYLSQYDDLVKSHFNPTDRRIKSVSSKNGSSILIEGPINTYDNYSVTSLSKSKVIYRCTVASCHQESLDKCINYLKETFPNTYLRNGIKHILK